jgi:hypothetical protein
LLERVGCGGWQGDRIGMATNEIARRIAPGGSFVWAKLLVPNTLMNGRSWNGAGFNSLFDRAWIPRRIK